MQYVAIVGSVMSAYGQYKQGQYMKEYYRQQAQMAEIEATAQSLQYEQKAVDSLDKTLRTMSAINARAGSANLDPFSGSIGNLTSYALSAGYKDYTTAEKSSRTALSMGAYQAGIHREAGKQAYQQGIYSAMGTLGQGAMQYKALAPSKKPGGGPSGNTSPSSYMTSYGV